jgi:hypothetical protein
MDPADIVVGDVLDAINFIISDNKQNFEAMANLE